MSEKTITIEVSVEDAKDYIERERDCRIHELVADALAEHDAKENPLRTPWEAKVTASHSPFGFNVAIADTGGGATIVPQGLTEAQARLMSAAPELADALERLLPLANETVNAWALAEKAKAALKKAGRR